MQTAIVTGASQGFGLALTRALIGEGWTVIADARNAERLVRETASLSASGKCVAIPGDVTESRHQADLIAAAEPFGTLDLLVHNASDLGPSPLPRLVDLPPEALKRLFEVNVCAPVQLTQRALPLLTRSDAPAIVMLSSDAAVEAYEGWGGYGASKAALDQIAAVLSAEHPSLRVYAFDPGDMRTDMHQRAFPGEDISDRPEPETVVPALLDLLRARPDSGRYRSTQLSEGLAP